MEPMPSSEPADNDGYTAYGESLLGVARSAIESSLKTREPLTPEPEDFAEPLREWRSCFVTLHVRGALHGCLGTLEPVRPLVCDVSWNAHGAAFRDARFPALREEDLAELAIHISILSPLEPMHVSSEQELLALLRPGQDGLVIRDGVQSATFLPAVWESLPRPEAFLLELKRKAGLAPDHWSQSLEIQRYTAESIP